MDSFITNTISVIFSLTGLTVISGTHIWLLVSGQVDNDMYITLASSNLASCVSISIGFLISQYSLQTKDKLIKTLREVTVSENRSETPTESEDANRYSV